MLPVTTAIAAFAAVMLVCLSFSVSLRRMKVGTDLGMGEDTQLMRRIRAQGNFIEYVPLALIVLVLAEYRSVAAAGLWTIAGLLVGGRLLHAGGILSGSTPLRAAGMLATYGSLLVGAVLLVAGSAS